MFNNKYLGNYKAWYEACYLYIDPRMVSYGLSDWPSRCEWIVPKYDG